MVVSRLLLSQMMVMAAAEVAVLTGATFDEQILSDHEQMSCAPP